ncbi:MAG: hypothetical protein AB1428_09670 [Bacteroidota bacterium]
MEVTAETLRRGEKQVEIKIEIKIESEMKGQRNGGGEVKVKVEDKGEYLDSSPRPALPLDLLFP